MRIKSVVDKLRLSVLGVCLIGSVCTGSNPIEGDEGSSWIDGEQLTKDECQALITRHMGPIAKEEISSSKALRYCKQQIEKDTLNRLAELKGGARERVNTLVESVIAANGGGEKFEGEEFSMPDDSFQRGILVAMAQSGVDLYSTEHFEYVARFLALVQDCNQVLSKLNDAAVYRYFMIDGGIQTQPTVAQWARNTMVCIHFTDKKSDLAKGAYRLLEHKRQKTPIDQGPDEAEQGLSIGDKLKLCFGFLFGSKSRIDD